MSTLPAATAANPIRVMIVDDSAIIRGLVTKALNSEPGIEIVASAANGAMALNMLKPDNIDVVLLDIEMPEMDGLTALPKLLAIAPGVKIIMVSSLTTGGAEISMRALKLGATDCIAKPSSRNNAEVVEDFYRDVITRVKSLGHVRKPASLPVSLSGNAAPLPSSSRPAPSAVASLAPLTAPVKPVVTPVTKYPMLPVQAIAIASSTGGPQALLAVFGALKGKLPNVPIYITQHMPATFTTILAEHISKACERTCVEGKEGAKVVNNSIYLAPGDYHMVAEKTPAGVVIHTNQNPPENFCRPAADPMIRSLSEIYQSHLLVVVLTGMGSDGCEGSKVALSHGGTIIAQNEETCVVWGMPRAVTEAGICSAVLPLNDVAPYIIKAAGGAA